MSNAGRMKDYFHNVNHGSFKIYRLPQYQCKLTELPLSVIFSVKWGGGEHCTYSQYIYSLRYPITTPILEEKNFTQHGNEIRDGKNLGTRTIKCITALYVKHT
jgi:hypothetical protein